VNKAVKTTSGFSGATLIRTPDGLSRIKDLKYGDLLTTLYDNQYEFVNSVECARATEGLQISIDGLPYALVATPTSQVLTHREPMLGPEIEQVPAAMLETKDLVLCPYRTKVDIPYGSLHPLIEYSKFLGAFCASGKLMGGSIIFSLTSINDTLRDEISRRTDDYTVEKSSSGAYMVIDDEELIRAVSYVFGISGSSPLGASVLNLSYTAKFVLLGGFIDACGFVQQDGNILCQIKNMNSACQILEMLWGVGVRATISKPSPPQTYNYSLIIEDKSPYIEENHGVLKNIISVHELPNIKLTSNGAALPVDNIQTASWDNQSVYSIDTAWNLSYVAGMVAVGGEYEKPVTSEEQRNG
jgi:hypothetical protein